MKFLIKSVCKFCGRIFDNYKRYNTFVGEWEPETDVCDSCTKEKALVEQSNIAMDDQSDRDVGFMYYIPDIS